MDHIAKNCPEAVRPGSAGNSSSVMLMPPDGAVSVASLQDPRGLIVERRSNTRSFEVDLIVNVDVARVGWVRVFNDQRRTVAVDNERNYIALGQKCVVQSGRRALRAVWLLVIKILLQRDCG